MDKELLDFILSITEDNYSNFIKSSELDINMDDNLEFVPLDHSWIDVVERYVPFLKGAFDNPYLEIIDIADSQKLYENRFLISLILKLEKFIQEKQRDVNERLSNSFERHINVKSTVEFELEDVEIEFSIKSRKKEDLNNGVSYGLTASERIERLNDVVKSITENNFFKSLRDVKLVTSPIHCTNVILEDQNLKKLLELWDFLENCILIQKTVSNKKVQTKQKDLFENRIKNTCFINYKLLDNINDINTVGEDYYKDFLEKIIESLVIESTMDDKMFKKMVNKKFEEEYVKKQNREKNIHSIFNKSIDSYQKQIKDALRCLK